MPGTENKTVCTPVRDGFGETGPVLAQGGTGPPVVAAAIESRATREGSGVPWAARGARPKVVELLAAEGITQWRQLASSYTDEADLH